MPDPQNPLQQLFDRGLPLRREVLGAEYVDGSLARANDFMMAMQRLTTEWGWGYAWGRPGLEKKTRSMLNLAMLTALNRPVEIKLHLKGALNNGLTPDDIKEILLHATVYCGIPAGLDAFKIANQVLEEEGAFKNQRESAAADSRSPSLQQLFDQGLQLRREVLGAEYVDGSLARANDFMMAFQRITTEWCWGYAWGRPGLEKKTRSMLNLVMLTALNRPAEIKLHVKGALNNGVTVDEIKEVLLHATVYCGIPAGLDAFKVANQVLEEEGAFKGKKA